MAQHAFKAKRRREERQAAVAAEVITPDQQKTIDLAKKLGEPTLEEIALSKATASEQKG